MSQKNKIRGCSFTHTCILASHLDNRHHLSNTWLDEEKKWKRFAAERAASTPTRFLGNSEARIQASYSVSVSSFGRRFVVHVRVAAKLQPERFVRKCFHWKGHSTFCIPGWRRDFSLNYFSAFRAYKCALKTCFHFWLSKTQKTNVPFWRASIPFFPRIFFKDLLLSHYCDIFMKSLIMGS